MQKIWHFKWFMNMLCLISWNHRLQNFELLVFHVVDEHGFNFSDQNICLVDYSHAFKTSTAQKLYFCVLNIMVYAFSFFQFQSNISCYRRTRSQSCPFCRDSLKRVNSGDLWIYTSSTEVVDLSAITRENLKRLFMYIENLPFIVPDPAFVSYDPLRWSRRYTLIYIQQSSFYLSEGFNLQEETICK